MTRTPRGAGASALALALCASLAIGLSACSTVPAKAATVDGDDITRSDFERDLRALAANPGLLSLTGGTEVSIDGETARGWLRQVIIWKTAERVLADAGLETSQDAIDAVTTQLESNESAKGLPQDMKDEIVQGAAALQSLSSVPAPSAEDLEAQYASDPARTGALCVRHIVVDTEAEAKAVRTELQAGADFAELAKERSKEPAAAQTGGALGDADGKACLPLGTFQSQFDPAFTAGALAAEPGQPSQPVQSQSGWHIILIRPYEEVADDLAALVASGPGEAAVTGALATADVTVDPRYGRWDSAASDVASLH